MVIKGNTFGFSRSTKDLFYSLMTVITVMMAGFFVAGERSATAAHSPSRTNRSGERPQTDAPADALGPQGQNSNQKKKPELLNNSIYKSLLRPELSPSDLAILLRKQSKDALKDLMRLIEEAQDSEGKVDEEDGVVGDEKKIEEIKEAVEAALEVRSLWVEQALIEQAKAEQEPKAGQGGNTAGEKSPFQYALEAHLNEARLKNPKDYDKTARRVRENRENYQVGQKKLATFKPSQPSVFGSFQKEFSNLWGVDKDKNSQGRPESLTPEEFGKVARPDDKGFVYFQVPKDLQSDPKLYQALNASGLTFLNDGLTVRIPVSQSPEAASDALNIFNKAGLGGYLEKLIVPGEKGSTQFTEQVRGWGLDPRFEKQATRLFTVRPTSGSTEAKTWSYPDGGDSTENPGKSSRNGRQYSNLYLR